MLCRDINSVGLSAWASSLLASARGGATLRRWGRVACKQGMAATVAGLLSAGAAFAANVDLAVNVSADKANYTATEIETYTVVIANRGPVVANNASFTLDVPSSANSNLPWSSTITCVASGGAVCPAAYTLPLTTTTVSGTVPSLPLNGKVTLTIKVPGSVTSNVSGAMRVVARVTPGAGDTNLDTSTDLSYIVVYIIPPRLGYGTAVAGPASAFASTQATYTVVLQNTSVDTNDIVSRMSLAALPGTGSAPVPAGYLRGTKFNSITCTGATGGASCANVVATASAPLQADLLIPQPSPLVNRLKLNGDLKQSIGATQMPGGSTITLTVVVDIGVAACSTTGAPSTRELWLSSAMNYITVTGRSEFPFSPLDNSGVTTTTVAALPCAIGDLLVNGINQPAAQISNGVGPNAPFSYEVVYSNASGAPANNVALNFSFAWPTSGASLNTPTCVAAVGAICPASYSLSGGQSVAIAPVMPAGGSLTITYTGISGGDTTQQCKPLYGTASAQIDPPADFQDTNFDQTFPLFQTGANRQGNNSYQAETQANIGVPCAPSYDAVATIAGPYSDYAATILAPMPLQPGQWVYFRSSASNAAPGPSFIDYDFVTATELGKFDFGPNFQGGNFSRAHVMGFVAKPGDPPGLLTDPNTTFISPYVHFPQFDMGVHCTASFGATCPEFLFPAFNGNGGVGGNANGWLPRWSTPTVPVFPVTGRLDFISTYRVPPLDLRLAAGGCVIGGLLITGTNVASFEGPVVDPIGTDRTTINDTVRIPIQIAVPACDQTLAVAKTIASPIVPASGLLDYTIVVTNTSTSNLDLPRLVDFTEDKSGFKPSMTINCSGTTGGAQCPSFTPQQGVKVLADGSSRPIDVTDGIRDSADLPSLDFVWGTAGANTMPPGSTVTFHVLAQYPVGQVPRANNASFTGDATSTTGRWPTAVARVGATMPGKGAFGVAKAVTPLQALPGQTVTYTVDALNYTSDETNVAFIDSLSAAMSAANPAGFSNLACTTLTVADNVFPAFVTVVPVTCPVFTNAASGITATIASFPANSGFRLTYTAIAPALASSVPNTVQLLHSAGFATQGDAASQVNYIVLNSVILSGNVFDDINGSQIKDNGETSSTIPLGLNAVITDSTGAVVAVVPIDGSGNYSTPIGSSATYTVTLTTASPAIGSIPPGGVTVTLPAGWLTTGENLAGIPDATPSSTQTVVVGAVDRPNVNFGLEQPPVAGNAAYPVQGNPNGIATVPVGAGAFTGTLPATVTGTNATDPAPGAVTGVTITAFPSNATTITINGTTYTSGNFPLAGVSVTVAQLAGMNVDPIDGAVSVVIPYTVVDAAGKTSGPGTVTLPFVIGPDVSTLTTAVNNGNGTATFTVVTSNAPTAAIANNTVTTLTMPTGLVGVVVSNGGVYNSVTGVVTWPPIVLNPGASNPTPQTVQIPYVTGTTVIGPATVTTNNEALTVLANNPSQAFLLTPLPVPTLTEVALGVLLLLLLLVGAAGVRRRALG